MQLHLHLLLIERWRRPLAPANGRSPPRAAGVPPIDETKINGDGELLSCRRVRRYPRGRGVSEENDSRLSAGAGRLIVRGETDDGNGVRQLREENRRRRGGISELESGQ
jgi:hypothetical protein